MRAVMIVTGVIFGLIISEILLQLINFSFFLYPERIEFGFPDPVVIKQYLKEDPALFWVHKDYDKQLEFLRRKRVDMIFMGDSCTEGSNYHFLLVEKLNRSRKDKDAITFASVGTTGYSTYQGRIQLVRDILALRPKVVAFYFGWNDHWFGFGIRDSSVPLVQSRLFQALRRFRIFQLLTKFAVWIIGIQQEVAPPRVTIDEFKENLLQMAKSCMENGILPLLITAPSGHVRGKEPIYLRGRWLKDLSDLVPLHQLYVHAVREVAAKINAPLCDLATSFESPLTPDPAQNPFFLQDGIHFTPAGNAKAADELMKCLKDQGLIERLKLQE